MADPEVGLIVGFHTPARDQAVWSWYAQGEDVFHDVREPYFIVEADAERGAIKIQASGLGLEHTTTLMHALRCAEAWLAAAT